MFHGIRLFSYPEPPVRAATYVRMSTADQENSPERQRNQITPYCKSRGYTVVAKYEDLGLRGTDDSRPDFQRLLRDAREGKFDVLVIDEQSRLARTDPVDFIAEMVSPLRNAGVRIDTVAKGVLDWSDLGQFIIGSVTQHASSTEVTTLSRRVVTELARKALSGDVVAGKAPYGYSQIWKDQSGKVVHRGKRTWTKRPSGWEPGLEVNETEAAIVRWVFKAYIEEDKSLNGIAKALHNQGVKSPRGGDYWNRSHLRNLLTSRVYVGDFVFNRVSVGGFHKLGFVGEGESRTGVAVPKKGRKGDSKATKNAVEDWVVIENHHPALVEREQWERVQKALKVNQKRSSPTASRGDYVLANLLRCQRCGSAMIGDRDGNGKFYLCGGYARNGPNHCHPFRVREEDAVDVLLEGVRSAFIDPNRKAAIRKDALNQKGERDTGLELARLHRAIGELDRKITKGKQNILLLDADLVPNAQSQIKQWDRDRKAAHATLLQLESSDPVADAETVLEFMDRG